MKLRKMGVWVFLFALLISLNTGDVHSFDSCSDVFSSIKQDSRTDEKQFVTYLSGQVTEVLEFKFIRDLAQKMGIRVWLFGGTASSFLHYVKWDWARRHGWMELQKQRFDYDFTHIFRSTQDVDIVVDATPEVAMQFQEALVDRFPHFLGKKANAWEVRTLRYRMGRPGEHYYKEALLEDRDFQDQNSDSHSVGMVEVTVPTDEPIVRDLRHWDQSDPPFLKDVIRGEIHFLRSDRHFQTSRALAGENPEILSVLRILVKAFQFDLRIAAEDLQVLKEILNQFDAEKISHPVANRRFFETAKKLVIHAANLESAFNQLDAIGLRNKLIEISSPNVEGTLGWWLNREPLRSQPLGQGTGSTAKELGIQVVAHETKDFSAFESITRSYSGEPNVFISRNGAVSESAMYGNGFYTTIGRKSSRGTGMTIRFKVAPEAREGSDFIRSGEMVIFKNKKALKIIPESLYFGLEEIVKIAEINRIGAVDSADRGLFEKRLKHWTSARILSELEPLFSSDSEEKLKKGLWILSGFQNLKIKKWFSEEVRHSVIKNSYRILSQKHSSAHEEIVLEYVRANRIFTDLKDIFDLFIQSRQNLRFRKALFEVYAEQCPETVRRPMETVLDAEDLTDLQAYQVVYKIENFQKLRLRGDLAGLKEIFKIRYLTQNTSVESRLNDELLRFYAEDEIRLGRELWAIYSDPTYSKDSIDHFLETQQASSFSMIQAFQQIAHFFRRDLSQAAADWIQAESERPELKAVFLLTQFGSSEFENYSSMLPQGQQLAVLNHVLGRPGLGVLERLAIQHSKTVTINESFQFQRHRFPAEGKKVQLGNPDGFLNYLDGGTWHLFEHEVVLTRPFEIQATPVTQLQWSLVMGENPSHFMSPSRPVEQVSWEDAQKFIHKLNELDPEFDYRLPTEAEWEYAARGGIQAQEVENPKAHSWMIINSNSQTHEVAQLNPNPTGLYDLIGNVWEWVQDRYKDQPPTNGTVDPQGPRFGMFRVVRGGAYDSGHYHADQARYTLRNYRAPDARNKNVGFRLVRVPKGSETKNTSIVSRLMSWMSPFLFF